MGIAVVIYGKSGSGKSRSLKNFGEQEILFVNVGRKPLPFRKQFTYTLETDDVELIKAQLKHMGGLKTAVIDDAGFLMTHPFMRRHSAGQKGKATFDLYNDIADSFWGLIQCIKNELPKDRIVYLLLHEEKNDFGETKIQTIGSLLDGKAQIEKEVTITLQCIVKDKKHMFRLETDGLDIVKAPEDMFQKETMENDLKTIDCTIREYYHLTSNSNVNITFFLMHIWCKVILTSIIAIRCLITISIIINIWTRKLSF